MTEEDIKKIVKHITPLIEYTETFLSNNGTYQNEDHLGFMVLLFLSKQLDHVHSIIRLCPTRDTVLIARSMIEGFLYLKWAAEDPDKRALKWRSYAAVADWKLLNKKDPNEVSDEDKNRILDLMKEHGDQFLKKSGQNLVNDNQRENLSPLHYHSNFLCGQDLPSILREFEDKYPYLKEQYDNLYVSFSDWAHWGTSGLGQAIETKDNNIKYSEKCYGLSASSLACGFECLYRTLELANHYFKADLKKDLDKLVYNYLKDMGMKPPALKSSQK